jgi:hypothetical protein
VATAEPNVRAEPSLASVRDYLRGQFNAAVRKPGMYGGEIALELYLDALAVACGGQRAYDTNAALQRRGAFNSLGVGGAFRQFWPGLESSHPAAVNAGVDGMAASVYAEIGRQRQWLDLDRALTGEDFADLISALPGWCRQDRTVSDVLAAFGPPSVSGGSNTRYPTTLLYATARPADPCISFHLWNSFAKDGRSATEYPEPMLLAARREGGPFAASFTLTPLGRDRTIEEAAGPTCAPVAETDHPDPQRRA